MGSRTRLRELRDLLVIVLFILLFLTCVSPSGAEAPPAGWPMLAGNAQHTGVTPTPAQSLKVIHWSTPVDEAPPSGAIFIHYGSPIVTPSNT